MAVLRKDEVVDSWSVLIGKASGKADDVLSSAEELVQGTEVPNVRLERRQMAPGVLAGLFGTKRDFLVVTEQGNRRLKPYQMYINARDYGTNLAVDWHLVYKVGFRTKAFYLLLLVPFLNLLLIPFVLMGRLQQRGRGESAGLDLDLFDQQDLTAYVTNAHHCLLSAVDKLMNDLQQDASKIDRRSRGFLGVS